MNTLFVKYRFVITSVAVWFVLFLLALFISPYVFPLRSGYMGPIPLANFDGIHYLRIASEGYSQYSEAFFPLYPFLISCIGKIIPFPLSYIGVGISFMSFFVGLLILYSYVQKVKNEKSARYTILFLLSFPTAFFFMSVYTEGLFFLLSVSCVAFVRNKKWLIAGLFGALAGATRLVGIFLIVYMFIEYIRMYNKKHTWIALMGIMLVPIGLLAFMWFLYRKTGDPLAFMHVQSAFGANRSDIPIITLPQVLWRYGKIIFTAYMQPTAISYLVTIAELVVTISAFAVLWVKRHSLSLGLTVFSFFVLLVPTMTGTFSSMTRYVLAAFPLYISLGTIHNTTVKNRIIVLFATLQFVAAGLFFRGWFIG